MRLKMTVQIGLHKIKGGEYLWLKLENMLILKQNWGVKQENVKRHQR